MAGYLLENMRLIDGTGRVWDRAHIRVEGERIQGVSEARPMEDAVPAFDLTGKTAVPGLINCHTHVCGQALEGGPGVTPDQLVAEHAVRGAAWLEDALLRGVTAIRDVGGGDHVDLALKGMVERGVIAGPRMRASGRYICMTGGHGWERGLEVDGPDEARRAARLQLRAGADTIKVMATGGILTPGTRPGSPQLTREEMAAAAEEAHKAGRAVAAHAEGREGILNAILAGVDSIEHGYELDDEIIELMLERGTFLCPTLTCDLRIAERGLEFGLSQEAVDKMNRWIDRLLESFQRAYRAGVRIAAGNDALADWVTIGDMAGEIAAMVEHGMEPHDALLAATAEAAELLRLSDEGTVEPGKRANLLIVDGDPLADIGSLAQVAGVIKDGKWVTEPVGER